MKRTHLFIAIVGVATMLAAEPVCRVVLPAIHRHHSKATLAKWASWRAEHPQWKPKTKKETLAALKFACVSIVTLDADTTELLAPPEAPAPMQLDLDAVDVVSPAVASSSESAVVSEAAYSSYPFQMPYVFFTVAPPLPPKHCKKCKGTEPPPPVIVPVPEPDSVWMVLVGFAGLGWIKRRYA